MLENLKKYYTNRTLILATFLFQGLYILDMFTVFYVVTVESEIFLGVGSSDYEGYLALIIAIIVGFITNLFFNLVAFTRLRTTTVLFPFAVILGIILFLGFGSNFLDTLSFVFAGIFIGFFYAFIFYVPAVWIYFRFRMPYLALTWASIAFLTSLLVANDVGSSSGKALIRPDYLIISGIFYFLIILLLILDNSQALARWRKLPEKFIDIPLKSLIPIFALLLVACIGSNIISPYFWKILWEKKRQVAEQISPDDLDPNATQGRAGNLQQNPNGSIEMNPNQELQSAISLSPGANKILFVVKVEDDSYFYNLQPYYWKTDVLDSFDAQKGFFNEYLYQSDLEYDLTQTTNYEYFPSNQSNRIKSYADFVNQTIVMVDLKSQWLISSAESYRIKLLTGKNRSFFMLENNTAVLEKNYPLIQGDSYEVESVVSPLGQDIGYVLNTPPANSYNSYEDSTAIRNNTFFPKYSDITNLAQEITGEQDNQLDKILAVQSYLLDNYSYTLEPGDPANLDPANAGLDRLRYFLFENKEGYCTYFASAMVALLRSVDIPARVVGGFSEGEYVEELDAFVITGAQAHAWVEVYFEGYGWIKFDPTPRDTNESNQITKDFRQNFDQQKQEQIAEILEELEKIQTEDPEYKPNLPTNSPFKPKEESKDWEQFMESISDTFNTLKYFLLLMLCLVLLLIAMLPPVYNLLMDQILQGKLSKRPERDQIIAYYKYLERKARKLDPKLRGHQHETAKQFMSRFVTQNKIADPALVATTEDFSEIYNRAAFRYDLHPDDSLKMARATEIIANAIQSRSSLLRKIFSYWTF